MNRISTSPLWKVAALAVVIAMCLMAARAADATAPAPARAERTVAHTKAGHLTSRIVGTNQAGRKVTGSFVPLKFVKRDGRLVVRGLVQGVVHHANGERTTFASMRHARVKSINGTPAHSRQVGRRTCDILHLVLAPLDLDLLGLQVHLNRVVLNIVAVTGAGRLLGNLLCAVTGLLDGGVGRALGRLVNLLNQVLARLRLG